MNAPPRRFVFQTEISGKYIVLVLISLLFYIFSPLRRGDQSTVFCIVSFDLNLSRSRRIRYPFALVCRCGLADIRRFVSYKAVHWERLIYELFHIYFSLFRSSREDMNSINEWFASNLIPMLCAKNSGIAMGQTLLVSRRKCTTKSCFHVEKKDFGERSTLVRKWTKGMLICGKWKFLLE